MGVTLYYENAWRDKRTGQWIDASFHFLEQVEFYKPGQESKLSPDGLSIFKWNDLVFRNFQEGNLERWKLAKNQLNPATIPGAG